MGATEEWTEWGNGYGKEKSVPGGAESHCLRGYASGSHWCGLSARGCASVHWADLLSHFLLFAGGGSESHPQPGEICPAAGTGGTDCGNTLRWVVLRRILPGAPECDVHPAIGTFDPSQHGALAGIRTAVPDGRVPAGGTWTHQLWGLGRGDGGALCPDSPVAPAGTLAAGGVWL